MLPALDLNREMTNPAGSLMTTIAKLAGELKQMRSKLAQAQREIERLSGELTRTRRGPQVGSQNEMAALRRRVAYYCHPDRGGDGELMSKLNMLFDSIEQAGSQG